MIGRTDMDFFSYEHARQAYEDEQRIIRTGEPLLDVLKTATPGETIRVAREHAGEIHMLMTDLIMPEMNGRNLARRLLALSPDRKYLFMSGYTADVIANQGMLEDELSFIQKPFSAEGLSEKVRETLG
jgi:DNA-binding NtrC family response regulator